MVEESSFEFTGPGDAAMHLMCIIYCRFRTLTYLMNMNDMPFSAFVALASL